MTRCSRRRTGAYAALAIATALFVAGCAYLPTWLGGTPKKTVPPPPAVAGTAPAKIVWQSASGGRAAPGYAPAVAGDTVYSVLPDGTLVATDARNGSQRWRQSVGKRVSTGPGSDGRIVVVGTAKGEVLAFDTSGKPRWESKVSSEVVSPPEVAEGIVVVWSGDARIFGLSAEDGKRRWVYQRTNPPLVIRNPAGGDVESGILFSGMAGGRLIAVELATGSVGWEANVATPKGSTELERIADVVGLPVIDQSQVCAVAYQGRVACFDVRRGTLKWSRDLSSLSGLVADARYLYLSDDKGAVHALDKATGASAWKQDGLTGRSPSGPQLVGAHLGVVDVEGRVYLMTRGDGAFVATLTTDGTPAVSQPARNGDAMTWLSAGGTLYTVGAP